MCSGDTTCNSMFASESNTTLACFPNAGCCVECAFITSGSMNDGACGLGVCDGTSILSLDIGYRTGLIMT